MIVALLLQAAPDLELGARVRARSVTIEQRGTAELRVTASPDAGSAVNVQAPRADGRRTLRNVEVTVSGQARIADPQAPVAVETRSDP